MQLMQKFSKKLVSKVIYVKILKASSSELLESFLNEKGWELLNQWFIDAVNSSNWPLCLQLIQLFALCPISATRLKENLDVNQAPRLIRQLSSDTRVDSDVRSHASQLLTRWMSVVSPQQTVVSGAQPRTLRLTRSVIVPNSIVPGQQHVSGHVPRVLVAVHTSTEEIINRGNMTVSNSNNSGMTTSHHITTTTQALRPGQQVISVDPFDAILSTGISISQPVPQSQIIGVIRNECLDTPQVVSQPRLAPVQVTQQEPTGGVSILQGLANELSETLKKEVHDEVKKEDIDKKIKVEKVKDKHRDKDRSKDSHRSKDKDRHRDRDKERDRKHSDEKRRREKERQREKERKEKKRESKPFRETEMRDGVDSAEKQRIKELAQKMKEDIKSLPKIPKVAKKEDTTKKETASVVKTNGSVKKPSFADLMSAMETPSTKSVKAAPIKNKNRDLLESLSNEGSSKPTSKSSKDSKKIDRTEFLMNMKTEDKSKLVKSSSDTTIDKKSETKVEDDKKAVKRPHEEAKLKIKSQAQLVEAPGFGDFLSTIIPDVPKKKKIKLADLKAQKEVKEDVKQEENEKKEASTDDNDQEMKDETANTDTKVPTFSFYGEGNDADEEENENKDDMENGNDETATPSQEDDNQMDDQPIVEENSGPREVSGILVINKGAKRTRRIQWRPDAQLVETEYFEVEEGERVNVNKLKFEEQRKKELELEKARMQQSKPGSVELDDRMWPGLADMALTCDLPDIEYGGNSNEKKEQQLRETSTLQALFFNKNPTDPLEPDSGLVSKMECKPIPLEDTSGEEEAINDYTAMGWPEPVFDKFMANNPPPPVIPSANNILQNLIGSTPLQGNKQAMDDALFAAQKAAAETLLKQGLLPSKFMDQNIPPGDDYEQYDERDEMMEYDNGYDHDIGPAMPPQYPPGPQQHWRGGHHHNRGGPPPGFRRGGHGPGHGPMHRMGGHNDFGRSGGFGPRGPMVPPHMPPPMRGFPPRPPNGNFNRPRRPCKYWMETGFCREESRCKFLHPGGGR